MATPNRSMARNEDLNLKPNGIGQSAKSIAGLHSESRGRVRDHEDSSVGHSGGRSRDRRSRFKKNKGKYVSEFRETVRTGGFTVRQMAPQATVKGPKPS